MAMLNREHFAVVGDCSACGGQMIETSSLELDDARHVQLRCQDCRETGELEHYFEHGPITNADCSDVVNPEIETVRWIDCPNCRGSGEVVGCIDDICHGKGRCIHNGNDACPDCDGTGTQPRLVETDGGAETVQACPECDSTNITPTVRDTTDHDYYCQACGAQFDSPTKRERYAVSGLAGLARKLDKAEPGDVGEPMTDGGQTLGTWEDYDTHLMQRGTTRNDYFHSSRDCPRIDNPEQSVDRSENYVAYHEPDPCESCHSAMSEIATDGGRVETTDERPAFIDPQTKWVQCYLCNAVIEDLSRVRGIDLAPPEDLYPDMRPVCPDHDLGGDAA